MVRAYRSFKPKVTVRSSLGLLGLCVESPDQGSGFAASYHYERIFTESARVFATLLEWIFYRVISWPVLPPVRIDVL